MGHALPRQSAEPASVQEHIAGLQSSLRRI
jgi:hypothetical protein